MMMVMKIVTMEKRPKPDAENWGGHDHAWRDEHRRRRRRNINGRRVDRGRIICRGRSISRRVGIGGGVAVGRRAVIAADISPRHGYADGGSYRHACGDLLHPESCH